MYVSADLRVDMSKTHINVNANQGIRNPNSSHQAGVQGARFLLACFVLCTGESRYLWILKNADMCELRTFRKDIGQRNRLLRAHTDVSKVDAFQSLHLPNVSAEQ